MNSKEKNLLDLQHSLSQTKGSLFFSIGIGSGVALFFGAQQIGIPIEYNLGIAVLFALPFIVLSIRYFTQCSDIQERIKKSIEQP